MPELPEVEVIVRGLKEKIVGHNIKSIEVRYPKVVGGDIDNFQKNVVGAKIVRVERRGKLIIVHLSNGNVILIHLKLTGQLIYIDKAGNGYKGGHSQKAMDLPPPNKFTHITLNFEDGSRLYFNDLRRFGWMKVVSEREYKSGEGITKKILDGIGPDPTLKEYDVREFVKNVKRRSKSSIYQVLMDQKVISGLGNIYVNELLWRCKINPQTKAGILSSTQIAKLSNNIGPLLADAIKYGGSSANTFVKIDGSKGTFTEHLDVYHREGEPCHRDDGGTIKRIKMGGRSAFYCPVCQTNTSLSS